MSEMIEVYRRRMTEQEVRLVVILSGVDTTIKLYHYSLNGLAAVLVSGPSSRY